ncbi:MAG: CpaF family protein [Anaerolineae bacterium]|nr:CpaF family protein [Anaerolineae bacterium]
MNNSPGSVLNAPDIAKLKTYLVSSIQRELEGNPPPPQQRREVIENLLEQSYANTKLNLPSTLREQIFRDILDDLLGYGPIQPLLEDAEISEVMVNGPDKVFIERNGVLERTGVVFEDDAHVLRIIERIVLPLGRHIDHDNPTVDARLPDGSRVNAVIPPVAIDGPTITIRKFAKERLGIADLIKYDSITEMMAKFLEACVNAHLNIVISGGTGSGKTTLLNILSSYIPEKERIVTIEDAAELQLQQDHVVRLETKAANVDGVGAVDIRQLVKNSLRMRPDRIVVGEVRSGEALDMLQAMNTGHDGSLTTVHANTPRDAISRLETLVLMAGMDMPIKIVREQIASAVDLIVQQSRLPDGSRKVTYITEVVGMEGDTVVMTDVFKFEQSGTDSNGKVIGQLVPTGIRPLFMKRLEEAGFSLGAKVFMRTAANAADAVSRGRR